MEREVSHKEALQAIDKARKMERLIKIMWIVCAALQAAIGTYSVIMDG